MKKLSVKAILSSLLLLLFLFLAISGAALYFSKTGMALGIPRALLRQAHFMAAAASCVLAALHFIINFKQYVAELRALGGSRGAHNSEKSGQDDETR